MAAISALALALILLSSPLQPPHTGSTLDSDEFNIVFYPSCNNTTLSSVEANVTFFNETSYQDVTNFSVIDGYSYDYQNNFSGNLTDVQAVIAVAAPPSSCPEGKWAIGGANVSSGSTSLVYLNFTGSPPPLPGNSTGNTTLSGVGNGTSLFRDFEVLAGVGLFSAVVVSLLLFGFRRLLHPFGGH